MGTALTEQHLRELVRLTKRLYLCFDADAAGEDATLRGMERAYAQGFEIRVVAAAARPGSRGCAGGLRGSGSARRRATSTIASGSSSSAPPTGRRPSSGRARSSPGAEDSPERQEALRLLADRLDLPRETLSGIAPARGAAQAPSTTAQPRKLLDAGIGSSARRSPRSWRIRSCATRSQAWARSTSTWTSTAGCARLSVARAAAGPRSRRLSGRARRDGRERGDHAANGDRDAPAAARAEAAARPSGRDGSRARDRAAGASREGAAGADRAGVGSADGQRGSVGHPRARRRRGRRILVDEEAERRRDGPGVAATRPSLRRAATTLTRPPRRGGAPMRRGTSSRGTRAPGSASRRCCRGCAAVEDVSRGKRDREEQDGSHDRAGQRVAELQSPGGHEAVEKQHDARRDQQRDTVAEPLLEQAAVETEPVERPLGSSRRPLPARG